MAAAYFLARLGGDSANTEGGEGADTDDALQAYQEANRTGQSISAADLASAINEALGGSENLTFVLAGPSVLENFLDCVASA